MRSSLRFSRLACCILIVGSVLLAVPKRGFGQAGLREALERLDRDGDGEVEPEEITPLARPYLERITRASRMSIDRDNDIEDLQRAARRYYAQKNGDYDRSVDPQSRSSVKPFGPEPDEPLVPEFGLPVVKYPYIQDDLDMADRMIRSRDRNRDGYIDRREAEAERWTHRNPFDDDFNKDDRLSRMELAQRYARRRLLDQASDELRQKAWRTEDRSRSSSRRDDDRREQWQWWRRGSNYWLSANILERFDADRNGRLEIHESKETGLPVGQIDINRDGELTRDELHAYLSPIQEEVGEMTEGIPGWFFELDEDGDRQVSMSEFASQWTPEKMNEFRALDLNGDALLTVSEITRAKSLMGGSYVNQTAEILPPGKTIVSEIEIDEDLVIADLNVQLSITHTHVGDLDGFLTGPDGQRVELFTEIGGRDDNFEETIFDDQASYPVVKARPPFDGSFQPEALTKRQPSLSHFTGMNARGVWQLTIRGSRSDRFGMMHYWSLQIRPEELLPGQAVPPPATAESEPESSAEASGEERPSPDSRTDWNRGPSRG